MKQFLIIIILFFSVGTLVFAQNKITREKPATTTNKQSRSKADKNKSGNKPKVAGPQQSGNKKPKPVQTPQNPPVLFGTAMDPVKWNISVKNDNTDHPSIVITAIVEPGYHLYAQNNPPGGSQPMNFTLYDLKGATASGGFVADKNYEVEEDDIFGPQYFYGPGKVTFTQKLKPTAKNWSVTVDIKGQACNESGCKNIHHEGYITGKFDKFRGYREPEEKD